MLSQLEEHILSKIVVSSDNDPTQPEFPVDNPQFPATPTYQIHIPWFENVWLKDESYNLTGTHKDRMAREIIVTYRDFLISKKQRNSQFSLPQFSIISSWSAAYAIQTLLRRYQLPALKVLVDLTVKSSLCDLLRDLWCEVYVTDLSLKQLTTEDILRLTDNETWFDITSLESLDQSIRFYDRLSYEIINTDADYCFIPFGTGYLYENILNISKYEITKINKDPRFMGNIDILSNCHFLWATTRDQFSKADKLYSPYLPFRHLTDQSVRMSQLAGYCGELSGIYQFEEPYLDMAIDIAKKNNIQHEPSWMAGLALMLQMKDTLPKDKRILIVNTGRSRYLDFL